MDLMSKLWGNGLEKVDEKTQATTLKGIFKWNETMYLCLYCIRWWCHRRQHVFEWLLSILFIFSSLILLEMFTFHCFILLCVFEFQFGWYFAKFLVSVGGHF